MEHYTAYAALARARYHIREDELGLACEALHDALLRFIRPDISELEVWDLWHEGGQYDPDIGEKTT